MQRFLNLVVQPNWRLMFYDLVRSNELDIWDINIIELTDLYLKKIKSMKELNLLVPANALLVAAILLKLKANTLRLSSFNDEIEEREELESVDEDNFIINNSINLESPSRIKEGQVSLDELMNIVDYMMTRPTKRNIERQISKALPEFIIPKSIEDISKKKDRLYSILKSDADSEGCTMFSRFKESVRDNFELISDYFLPLLFLSKDNKINIWQDDFFSDIFIKIL